ncbi:[FeFe] hydrogenase H-cluster radical SAM maturase HydE [bacterium]|nr:[FeFe] hydrogenase H-cluster radical SAM maturase HydE [bacterium]
MKNLIEKVKLTHILSKEEIVQILSNDDLNDELFFASNEIRKKYVGNEIYLRALIEFSNICSNNCLYCGIRAQNNNITRYKLSCEDIIATAQKASELGFKTVVLQSGEGKIFSDEEMIKIISEIKKFDVAVTLSIGEKTFEQYKLYKNAGADRFLLRIETTDKNLYEKMHPKMNFENRVQCLKNLKMLGYEVGTGCLVGLPNQTLESLADDLLFFKELDADMIGLGPFIATCNTPLEKEKNGSFLLARKMVALVRLLMPDVNIPATTAMETLLPNGRKLILQSGANVIMPNITPQSAREQYAIYSDKAGIDAYNLEKLKEEFKEIGRSISNSKGFRNK